MELCKTLEGYGFDLQLLSDGGMERVEARRTDRTQMTSAAAAPMLLSLSRQQDEAIAYLRTTRKQYVYSEASQWFAKIAKGEFANEREEAIAIYKYNLAIGKTHGSDGVAFVDCIKELEAQP